MTLLFNHDTLLVMPHTNQQFRKIRLCLSRFYVAHDTLPIHIVHKFGWSRIEIYECLLRS